MFTVAVLTVPYLLGQLISPQRPLLRIGPGPLVLLAAAVGLQLIAMARPIASGTMVPMSFLLGTVTVVWIFRRSTEHALPPVLAGLGSVANLLPIAVHGAMPVRYTSRALVEEQALKEPPLLAVKHFESDYDLTLIDPVGLLTDWIPLPLLNAVISPGDLLLVAGFVTLGLTARRPSDDQAVPNAANSATEGCSAIRFS